MVKAFYNEQNVEIDGETLRLVINFKAIDATEKFLGRNYGEILDELQESDCPIGTTGGVVWGLLREHHADMSIDQAATLCFGAHSVAVGIALTELLQAAFPVAKEEKGQNPPKRRGRQPSIESDG